MHFTDRRARHYMQLAKSEVTSDDVWRAISGNAPADDGDDEAEVNPPPRFVTLETWESMSAKDRRPRPRPQRKGRWQGQLFAPQRDAQRRLRRAIPLQMPKKGRHDRLTSQKQA